MLADRQVDPATYSHESPAAGDFLAVPETHQDRRRTEMRVSVLQRVVPDYRIPFFLSLDRSLGDRDCKLEILAGQPVATRRPHRCTRRTPVHSKNAKQENFGQSVLALRRFEGGSTCRYRHYRTSQCSALYLPPHRHATAGDHTVEVGVLGTWGSVQSRKAATAARFMEEVLDHQGGSLVRVYRFVSAGHQGLRFPR